MDDRIDRGGPSSSSAPSGPLAAAASGASSRPTGPAQRPSTSPNARGRRVGLATASIAALGTLALAIVAAGGLSHSAPASTSAVVATHVATTQAPAPTEQVVVDTVYVNAPAPTPQPPIVVPSKVQAQAKPPIRVVRIVKSAGGEGGGEGGDQAEAGGGND